MKPEIAVPLIAALVYRAWSHKSLTPVGIATAFATAVVHAIHPWGAFFFLLAAFFLAGTTVTKVCGTSWLRNSLTDGHRLSTMSRPDLRNLQLAHLEGKDHAITFKSLPTQASRRC